MSAKKEFGLDCGGKCTGACCRVAFVPLSGLDQAKWSALHGMRVFRIRQTGEYRALLDRKCGQLTACGKCAAYGTADRPKLCDDFWCHEMPDYDEVFLCRKSQSLPRA